MTYSPEIEPTLIETGQYDPEYRDYGDCAAQAVEKRPAVLVIKTCELAVGHNGVHDWDPSYEYPDD